MSRGDLVGAARRHAARWTARLDPAAAEARRWARLTQLDSDVTRDVVRAAYVAVLEREPDAGGLSDHAARLRRGSALELLLAELARARDTERTASRIAREAGSAADGETLSRLNEQLQAQRRTILALTRRLAALEDRLAAEGPTASKPSAAGQG